MCATGRSSGSGRKTLERQIEQVPLLPSGSQLVLDRVAQDIVLENVRHQLRLTRKGLATELQSYGDLPLAAFLSESGRDLADALSRRRFVDLFASAAGLSTPSAGPQEDALLRRVVALARGMIRSGPRCTRS